MHSYNYSAVLILRSASVQAPNEIAYILSTGKWFSTSYGDISVNVFSPYILMTEVDVETAT